MNKLLLLFAVVGCIKVAPAPAPTTTLPANNVPAPVSPTLQVVAMTTNLSPDNVLRWPKVVDDGSDIDDVINRALSFEAITGEKLEDVKARWTPGSQEMPSGVDATDFTVTANARGVLSIAIDFETVGAYPQMNHEYKNFDLATGKEVAIGDLLDPAALPAVAARLDTVLQGRVAATKQEHAADVQAGDVEATLWDDLHVTVDSLGRFSTTPTGITFHWDAGFPHAVQALAPDGELSVTFAELAGSVNPRGPWATAAR